MARLIKITCPSEKTDPILKDLKDVKNLLELKVYREVSVAPPGDEIALAIPNSSLQQVMRLLDDYGSGKENGISVSSTAPASYSPTQDYHPLARDNNEGSWEEMEMTISNDSNTSINTMMLLMIAGSLATVGIATNALHIVIGGMLIAPGFMPIVRVSLAMVTKYRGWSDGLVDFVKGYLALIIGAAITSLILRFYGIEPTSGTSSYYVPAQQLIQYWSTVTFSSLLASAVASIAGALLVATQKSVFTSGVMIGLALVPSAAIIPIGLIAGDFTLAGNAAIRFLLDVLLVFVFSLPVFVWAKMYYHKRVSSIR